jgi:hypothetical protein
VSAVPDLYRTADRASLADLGQAARPIEGRDDDYDELIHLIADRRVVLIGEASHGSEDFYASAPGSPSGSSRNTGSRSWRSRPTGPTPTGSTAS